MTPLTYQNHPKERLKEQAFVKSFQSPPGRRPKERQVKRHA